MNKKETKGSEAPKKAKYSFTKVMMEVSIDSYKELDLSKDLGNEVHRMTSDIGLDDIARKIYHDGEAEMDEKQAQKIADFVNHPNSKFNVAARQALTKILTPKK